MEIVWRADGGIRKLLGEFLQSRRVSQYRNKGNRGTTIQDQEVEIHRIGILPQDPLQLGLGF